MTTGRNPPIDVAPIDPLSGRFIPVWYDRFKFLDSLQPLPVNAPFTVTPITPGSTSATVTSRTVTDTNNSTTGVDAGTSTIAIGYNAAASATWFNSFTIIKNILNALYTNDANVNTAISAINTRVTALENKIDAVIADLDARFP